MLGLAVGWESFRASSLEGIEREVVKIFHLSRATPIVTSRTCYLPSPLPPRIRTFSYNFRLDSLLDFIATDCFFLP